MQCSLDTRLSALPQISEKKLTEILDKIPGQKDFIIDFDLIKPLEKVIGVSKLRCHGIDKIYKLETSGIPITNTQRVYFIKSNLITAKYICDQINSEIMTAQSSHSNKAGGALKYNYHVILVPRKLQSIVSLFEEEGIIGHVSIYGYQLELIILDSKILSNEFKNFFEMLFVNGNQSFLPCVAKSIWSLQMLTGKPYLTVVLGKYSQLVYNMVNNYFNHVSEPDKSDSDIGCFVIVDRDVDYASVLLTPGTYTSLLDKVFNTNCGTVEVKLPSQESYKIHLNNADEIYMQIKNRHFSDVFTYLKSRAEILRGEFQKSQNLTLQQMKSYVSKELKNVTLLKKLLTSHIGACEAIISEIGPRFESLQEVEHSMLNCKNHRDSYNYIENFIATDLGSKLEALRLISLLSLTNDGLIADELNSLKSQFLHKYGYKYLKSFNNLQNMKIIHELLSITDIQSINLANKVVQALPSLPMKRSTFYNLSQKMKLFPEITEEYDLKSPCDMSYIFGGAYIPLVCQLLSHLIKKDISGEELEKKLPNLNFKYDNSNFKNDFGKQSSYFVYFIGGVTYAEIAAFQLLENLTGTTIYVAGTSIINGNSLIGSVL